MKKILLFGFVLLFLVGCSMNTQYIAFVYPEGIGAGVDESKWIIKEGFKTLEACRDFSYENLGAHPSADYECGKNCRYKSDWGMHVCKETIR